MSAVSGHLKQQIISLELDIKMSNFKCEPIYNLILKHDK